MKSTMDSDDCETAELVDNFRQLRLKEYYEINNLCQYHGVQLTEKLLERGNNFIHRLNIHLPLPNTFSAWSTFTILKHLLSLHFITLKLVICIIIDLNSFLLIIYV